MAALNQAFLAGAGVKHLSRLRSLLNDLKTSVSDPYSVGTGFCFLLIRNLPKLYIRIQPFSSLVITFILTAELLKKKQYRPVGR